MEVQKVEKIYPKFRETVIAKSRTLFSFKNCPDEEMISKKIEIPGIENAKWWIEVGKCQDISINSVYYKSRTIRMCLDVKDSDSVISGENTRNYKAKLELAFNNDSSNKTEVEVELEKNREKFEKISMQIYHDPQNNIPGKYINVLVGLIGIDMKIEGRVEISCESGYQSEILENFGVSPMLKGIRELFDTGKFSDFKLIVSGKEFKVHKNILSIASPVFSAMFECDLDEKKFSLAKIESNPEIFLYFLEFVYKGKLPEKIGDVAIDLYEIAHLYQVEQLMEICLGYVLANEINMENALRIYKFAMTFDLEDLFDRTWNFIKTEILEIFEPINRDPFTIEEIRSYLKETEGHKQKMSKYFNKTENEYSNDLVPDSQFTEIRTAKGIGFPHFHFDSLTTKCSRSFYYLHFLFTNALGFGKNFYH